MTRGSILTRLAVQLVDSSVEKRAPVPCILADAQLGPLDARVGLLRHDLPGIPMVRDKPKPLG